MDKPDEFSLWKVVQLAAKGPPSTKMDPGNARNFGLVMSLLCAESAGETIFSRVSYDRLSPSERTKCIFRACVLWGGG